MVCDELCVILGSPQSLDPLGRALVLPRPVGPGDLAVRDIADEGMSERELALSGERRAALPADEPFALEPVQRRDRVTRVAAEALVQKTFPTTAASWRSVFSSRVRPSSRAAIMPWSVSGSGSSSAEPRST